MVLAMAAGVGHVAWWMAAHNIIAALSRMSGVRERRMGRLWPQSTLTGGNSAWAS